MVATFMGSGAFASEPERVTVIRTLIMEAIGEPDPETSMTAVGEVIRNRVADSRWPATAYEVVTQPMQFSCNNGDREANWKAFKRRNRTDAGDWQRAAKAWEASLTSNLTDGAVLYHAIYIAAPRWDWSKCEKTVTISNHVFYRELN